MASVLKSTPAGPAWPWWRQVLTALCVVAFALSVYLCWHYARGASMVGCNAGSDCERVLSSRWSTVGGVAPVAGLAAGAYLALLTASFYLGPGTAPADRRLAWRAMLVLSAAAAASAAWFIVVQKWLVGAFCPYCMATHAVGLLICALTYWKARGIERGAPAPATTSTGPSSPGALRVDRYAVAGATLAGVMALLQVGLAPPPVYRGGESTAELPAVEPEGAPRIGPADAPMMVVVLFDYNCPHCQKLHFQLPEAARRYDGRLAFELRPTPLNTRCNPYVVRDVDAFSTSCELARIGLAVWVADREAYNEFEDWIFSFESGDQWQSRSVAAAREKAIELVGLQQLDAAESDPWIERYLHESTLIYADAGGNAIPKLIYGNRWVVPEPANADELIAILQESLELPAPQADAASAP